MLGHLRFLHAILFIVATAFVSVVQAQIPELSIPVEDPMDRAEPAPTPGAPAQLHEDKGPAPPVPGAGSDEGCVVGQRVLTPDDKYAVVSDIEGTTCFVELEGTSEIQTWSVMLLRIIGQDVKADTTGGPVLGDYLCSDGSPGAKKLDMRFDVGRTYTLRNPADNFLKTGIYTTDPLTNILTFTSGPWENFYAKPLPNGQIGLSSDPQVATNYMICDKVVDDQFQEKFLDSVQ